jgi:hypothetical protein
LVCHWLPDVTAEGEVRIPDRIELVEPLGLAADLT